MKKRMLIMIISLAVLFGLIFLFKEFKEYMIDRYVKTIESPLITVSATKAGYSLWQPQIQATASLRAVLGVNVTTEAAGMVRAIYFQPGQLVKKGSVLVQLDIDPDVAQLHALQASAELAEVTYKRDKAQYAIKAISKATLDVDEANMKSSQAQAEQQIANIAKKTIYAPFDGRLGISNVNPGQYLNPGDKIVALETLNPVYADFYVPQAEFPQLKTGQAVMLTTDAFPAQIYKGAITTIDSGVNASSRNIEVEATLSNATNQLMPGMYGFVTVYTRAPQQRLTLPLTAISFNSYGEIAYILQPTDKKDKSGNAIFIAKQSFVNTGETRGDQVTITAGIKAGDLVVTSGQLKLNNGSQVIVNNTVAPANNPNPSVIDQ